MVSESLLVVSRSSLFRLPRPHHHLLLLTEPVTAGCMTKPGLFNFLSSILTLLIAIIAMHCIKWMFYFLGMVLGMRIELDNLFYANWGTGCKDFPLIIREWQHYNRPLGLPLEFLGDYNDKYLLVVTACKIWHPGAAIVNLLWNVFF